VVEGVVEDSSEESYDGQGARLLDLERIISAEEEEEDGEGEEEEDGEEAEVEFGRIVAFYYPPPFLYQIH
jgi:hypothetical protein